MLELTGACLVVPDIHLAHGRAQKILDRWPDVDHIVLLGDVFDEFNDTPAMAGATAAWLARVLEDPRVVPLVGNHDAGYLYPAIRQFQGCPGYTADKCRAIRGEITPAHVKRFRLAVRVNGWLLSHAGVNPYYLKDQGVDSAVDGAQVFLEAGQMHPLLTDAGYRLNWRSMPPGGILWGDWDHEFRPLRDTRQIVGHTPAFDVRIKQDGYTGTSVCLDTQLRHYAVLRNGGLEIFNSKNSRLDPDMIS